jgi:hypothetical protein
MIQVSAIAKFILGIALDSAKDQIADQAKKSAMRAELQNQLKVAKELIAEQVANAYSQQVKALSEGYIKAIQDSTLEIEFSQDESGKLVLIAENALRKLEVYLDEQNPDGPIIQYLQKRYEEENIKRITGRLYAGHYVNRTGEGVYKIYNRMAYAPLVDRNRPWLSGDRTVTEIGNMIAEKADQLFQEAFDVDLTDAEVRRT